VSEVRRDILLAIRSEFNQSGFDKANTALTNLEKRIDALRSKKIEFQFGGLSGAAGIEKRIEGIRNQLAKPVGGSFKDLSRDTDRAGSDLLTLAGRAATTAAAFGAVSLARRGIGAAASEFADFERGEIALQRVGRGFGSTAGEISRGAGEVAEGLLRMRVEFGVSGDEAAKAAVIFARLGLSQTETLQATRTALLASNVAGISASEAARDLASAMAQFQLSARDLPDLLNKLNTLENSTRVRTQDLLQAIGRAGSVFRDAGGSVEQFGATVAVVAQATGRSGAEIGNALRTISTRVATGDVQSGLLENFNIAARDVSGNLKPINELLGEMVVKMGDLSQAERAELTTLVAGNFQRNRLTAVLDNYFLAQAQVLRQLRESNSAEAENALVVQTLASKNEQLLAALERLSVSIGRGAGPAVKALVDGLRTLVDGLAAFGPVAAVVVGALTAYAVAVLLAATRSSIFTASLISLSGGIQSVNLGLLALLGRIGLVTPGMAAATAATAGATGGFAALGASIKAAIISAAPLAALVAPIAAVAAAVAAIRKATGAGVQIDPLNPDSKEGRELKKTDDQTTVVENRKKFIDATKTAGATAAAVLEQTEAKIRNGIALTNAEINRRQQAMEFLKLAAEGQADLQAKIASGTFTAADASDLVRRRTDESVAAQKAIIASIDAQIAKRRELQKTIQDEFNAQVKADKSGAFGRPFLGPKGFFQSGDDFDQQNVSKRKQLAKEIEELELRKRELQAQSVVQVAEDDGENFELAARRIKTLRTAVDEPFELRLSITSDGLTKTNLELARARETLTRINEDVVLQGQPSALRSIREELKEDIRALENKQRVAVKLKAIEEEDRKFETGRRVQERLTKFRVAIDNGPDASRGVREARAQIENEQQILNRLRAERERLQNSPDERSQIEAIRLDKPIVDGEKRLEESKLKLLDRQLDTLERISREKQKQLESTRKELAGLSDEELLKTRILASRVKNGQQKPISETEFLNLDKGTRELFSRFDGLFPGAQLTPDLRLGFPDSAFLKHERPFDSFRGAPRGFDEPPEAARSIAQPPAGALNIAVKLDGVEVPLDRITSAMSVLVTQEMQKYVNNSVQKVERTIKSNAPVRSR